MFGILILYPPDCYKFDIYLKLSIYYMKGKIYFLALALILVFSGCRNKENPNLAVCFRFLESGDKLFGTEYLEIKSNTDVDILSFEFFVDGEVVFHQNTIPGQVGWNTQDYTNSDHELYMKLLDEEGNAAVSDKYIVDISNYLFKANFTNNWLEPGYGDGYIFLSDMNDNILAETRFSGNQIIELNHPDIDIRTIRSFQVTTLRNDILSERVQIETNFNVSPGTEWFFKGVDHRIPDVVETITIDIVDPTPHYGFITSTRGNYTSFGWLPNEPFTLELFDDPASIYCKMDLDSEHSEYIFIPYVYHGTLEFSTALMSATSGKDISIPVNSDYFFNLMGYIDKNDRYSGGYLLDAQEHNASNEYSIAAHYPSEVFEDYETSYLHFSDSYGQLNVKLTETYGDLPDAIELFDGSVAIVNNHIDSIRFISTADYIHATANLEDAFHNEWIVFLPEDVENFKLPVLPLEASQLFFVDRSQFILSTLALESYPGYKDIEEILKIRFGKGEQLKNIIDEKRVSADLSMWTKIKSGDLTESEKAGLIRDQLR
jgi:hypothetical protein